MAWASHTLENSSINAGTTIAGDALGGLTDTEEERIANFKRFIFLATVRSSTAGNPAGGRFGLAIVTKDAFAAAALPEPIVDTDYPWLFNVPFMQEELQNIPVIIERDLKSNRRFPMGHRLVFIAESGGVSVGSLVFNFSMRFLYTFK